MQMERKSQRVGAKWMGIPRKKTCRYDRNKPKYSKKNRSKEFHRVQVER